MNHGKSRCLLTVLLVAVLTAVVPALAQVQTGDLAGTVRNDQGQALPGVAINVSGLGAPRVQMTGEQGEFRFLGLSPGTYALTAESDGYSKLEYAEVAVRLGGTTNLAWFAGESWTSEYVRPPISARNARTPSAGSSLKT